MSNAYDDFAKAFASATASQFASITTAVRVFSERNDFETSINGEIEDWVVKMELFAAPFTGFMSNRLPELLHKLQPEPLPPPDNEERTRAIIIRMHDIALERIRPIRNFTSSKERMLSDLGAPQNIWIPQNGVLATATDFYVDVFNTGYTTFWKAISLTLPPPSASYSIPVTMFQLFADAMASYADQLNYMTKTIHNPVNKVLMLIDLSIEDEQDKKRIKVAEGVRKLILEHYFTNVSAIGRVFVDVDKKILPNAMEWIGRDGLGFSAMYHLVRGNPLLFQQ